MILLRLKFKADVLIGDDGLKYIIEDKPNEKHLLLAARVHKARGFKLNVPSNTLLINYTAT
jgi:hypothetical protein